MTVAAIVPAAGRGTRLGPGQPKALRELAGTPMLVYAVQALVGARLVDRVVVAVPLEEVAAVSTLLARDVPADILVVAGGATRQESVARALAALSPDVDVVLVHDAARPLAPSDLADRVAAAVQAGSGAVVPGVPVIDTVKRLDPDGTVTETLDRTALRAVQTPQGFAREVLAEAHAADPEPGTATDDAALVERLGRPVRLVPGHEEAFKVTRPLDLLLAEAVLQRRRVGRVG